jgi:hypothetical protein
MRDKRVRQAAKLFEDFTGHKAESIHSANIPEDDVLLIVGECDAIAYTATRDGETNSYQHEFKPSARPVLCVSHDGQRLYLLAGAYRFTERGIEDN